MHARDSIHLRGRQKLCSPSPQPLTHTHAIKRTLLVCALLHAHTHSCQRPLWGEKYIRCRVKLTLNITDTSQCLALYTLSICSTLFLVCLTACLSPMMHTSQTILSTYITLESTVHFRYLKVHSILPIILYPSVLPLSLALSLSLCLYLPLCVSVSLSLPL